SFDQPTAGNRRNPAIGRRDLRCPTAVTPKVPSAAPRSRIGGPLEDSLELFLENLRIGVDPAVHPFVGLERRLRQPLLVLPCRPAWEFLLPSVCWVRIRFASRKDQGINTPSSEPSHRSSSGLMRSPRPTRRAAARGTSRPQHRGHARSLTNERSNRKYLSANRRSKPLIAR